MRVGTTHGGRSSPGRRRRSKVEHAAEAVWSPDRHRSPYWLLPPLDLAEPVQSLRLAVLAAAAL